VQLHVDLGEGVLERIARRDQAVVDAYAPTTEHHDQTDNHDHEGQKNRHEHSSPER
jgi:hypothetical protein